MARSTSLAPIFAIAAVCLGMGGMGLWHYSSTLATAMETADWISTPARVSRSERRPGDSSTEIGPSSLFAYTYSVQGQDFTGDRVTWGNTRRVGRIWLYEPGDDIIVYTNPDSPSEAVVRQGTDGWTWVQVSFSGLVALLGFWIACIGLTADFPADESRSPERLDSRLTRL